jgi:hypothetical protein
VRSISHARRATAAVAVLAALTIGLTGTAQAAKGGKGKPGGTTTTTTTTSTTVSATSIKPIHDSVCPTVAEYTACSSLAVTVTSTGAGSLGSSGPANGTVTYNSYYSMSSAQWAQTVSHEVGGHHDAWGEIVAKVGASQAWTDYYDLDYFGELWAEGRYKALKGTTRDFTRAEGKEGYLDCVGPVAHGYSGNYLSNWGLSAGSAQQSFCQGASTVMADSLTKVRPS